MDDDEPEGDYTEYCYDNVFPFAHVAFDVEQIKASNVLVQQRNQATTTRYSSRLTF